MRTGQRSLDDGPSFDNAGHAALRSAVLGPHTALGEMLEAAAGPCAPEEGPRCPRRLADAFTASTCRHLAAVEDTVLPAVRRRLPGGPAVVRAYLAQARELEHALHTVKAQLYGDAHASRVPSRVLWLRVWELVDEHERQETGLVGSLYQVMNDDDSCVLADRLSHVERVSPTRPHPYFPHAGLAGRVSHRFWSVLDGLWDSAEGRIVPDPGLSPRPTTPPCVGVPPARDAADPRRLGR